MVYLKGELMLFPWNKNPAVQILNRLGKIKDELADGIVRLQALQHAKQQQIDKLVDQRNQLKDSSRQAAALYAKLEELLNE